MDCKCSVVKLPKDRGAARILYCPLHNAAPTMYKLIETSLRAGRFPEVGDGCEVWHPVEVARALLREIEGEK